MKRTFRMIGLMLCVSLLLAADFTNTKARLAKAMYDKEVEDAKEIYDKAVEKAKDKYKKSLELALKDEMKKGEKADLEECNRIKEEIESLKSDKSENDVKSLLIGKWMVRNSKSVVSITDDLKCVREQESKVFGKIIKIDGNRIFFRFNGDTKERVLVLDGDLLKNEESQDMSWERVKM